jgi:putative SOS response-associated peptidase YedK
MCGRFTLTAENAEWIAEQLGVPVAQLFEESWKPRWNIAPMQEHWIVRSRTAERRELVRATWGLVNSWDRDRSGAARQINARSETLEERPAYRDAFRATRCIIPADGFYEWTGKRDARRPFWFHRDDDSLLMFAGLYVEARLAGETETITTFTIVTTDATGPVGQIHDRMPAILEDDQAVDEWLYSSQPTDRLRALIHPVPEDSLVVRAVSRRVNSVAVDAPACLIEAESETQVALL